MSKAALYLRVSLDPTGQGLAVERQREACLRIATFRGWDIVGEYVDNSISASDLKKSRPGYERLIRDYEGGLFDALVCWDLDRLTRRPRQLEDWIDRAEGRGLQLVTANGEADLSTDGGRMYARIKAAVARGEMERKSARRVSANQQRAAKGLAPSGVRLTGYSTDGQRLVPDEAAVVARMFSKFAEGESLRGLCAQLTADGVTTRHGRAWSPSSVRSILTNPRYAGRVVYQGEVIGDEAAYPAIIDADTFDQVNRRLADPSRRHQVSTDRKHLGSGLYRCGVCDGVIRAWSGRRYRCVNGCLARSGAVIDEYVITQVEQLLSGPQLADLLGTSDDSATAELSRQAADLHLRLRRVEADYDDDLIDGRRYQVKRAKIIAELEAVDRRRASLRTGPTSILAADRPVEAFREASLMIRREVVDWAVQVRLRPGRHGTRRFNPDSVVITLR